MGVSRIGVGGEAPYDVVVGTSVLGEVPALLTGAGKLLLVYAEAVRAVADEVAGFVARAGIEVHAVAVAGEEADKSVRTAELLWDALGRAELSRSDAVVAVGGGATTDLAGFVAATWLRGVRVVHVPTTLLAMVDAAVGGKTAINTAAGKNLVGAFYPPAGVVCDLSTLRTLPPADYASGLAEVVKTGFIADPAILDLVEDDPRRHARQLVERSIRVKADVVAGDLREADRREVLNYGHTLGHALERVEGYRWRHGDAVAVGMCFAAALGRRAGRLDDATADRHARLLSKLGLPTAYAADAWPRLLDAMRVDKKARGGRLRFVILDGVGKPAILEAPTADLLAAAYAEVST